MEGVSLGVVDVLRSTFTDVVERQVLVQNFQIEPIVVGLVANQLIILVKDDKVLRAVTHDIGGIDTVFIANHHVRVVTDDET